MPDSTGIRSPGGLVVVGAAVVGGSAAVVGAASGSLVPGPPPQAVRASTAPTAKAISPILGGHFHMRDLPT